ncbi:MAG: SDR family NAD(P)-dependent oxidoreductase [Bacteroidales bacterium]|jgi:short-subunit dehydrogenase|nr:SDR family NAD(P)-dependent oxidoreductase [Bacteroidales bacterium]
MKSYGKTALVAGASEGIGAAFAKELAAKGMDLILVARGFDKLTALAAEIEGVQGVKCHIFQCDLGDAGAADAISCFLTGNSLEVDILVYNAAVSPIGPYLEMAFSEIDRAVQVNITTQSKLLHILGGQMAERGRGAVIVVSSMAGLQGSGGISLYSATKAFGRVLAEGLWYEWRSKGVDVIACCAGATATPNYIKSNPAKSSMFAPKVQKPEEVVRECLKRLGKTPSFICGRGNRIASLFMHRLLPRKLAVKIMGDNTARIYPGSTRLPQG